MSNPNEQNEYTREVRKDVYEDNLGNTHTNVSKTVESTNTKKVASDGVAYRDGFVNGQVTEKVHEERRQVVRDNDNAVGGLLLGIIAASFLGLVGATAYFMTQRPTTTVPSTPVIIQKESSPTPAATQTPQPTQTNSNTTTIERTTDRVIAVPSPVLVPVPQQAPQNSAPTTTVPNTTTNTTVTPTQTSPATTQATPQGNTGTATPRTGNQ